MNTEPNDAFTAGPPTVTIDGQQLALRPLTPNIWKKLGKAEALMGDDFSGDTAYACAYVVTHSITVSEAMALVDDDAAYKASLLHVAFGLEFDDAKAVGDYLSALLDRLGKSQLDPPPEKTVAD